MNKLDKKNCLNSKTIGQMAAKHKNLLLQRELGRDTCTLSILSYSGGDDRTS